MAGRRLSSNDVSVVIALAIVVLVLLLTYLVATRQGGATEPIAGDTIDTRALAGDPVATPASQSPGSGARDGVGADGCGIQTLTAAQSESEGEAIANRQRDEVLQAILAALETSPEPRARAAGLYFRAARDRIDTVVTPACQEHAGDCSSERARHEGDADSADALARLAVESMDPQIYAWAYHSCAAVAGAPMGSCQMVNALQWARLDPRNAAPWFAVAREAKSRGDAGGLDDAMFHVAAATIQDPGWGAATSQMIAAAPRDDRMVVGTWLAALGAIGYETLDSAGSASSRDTSRYCDARAVRNANRRDTCDKIATLLVDRSTTLMGRFVGIGLAKKLEWPAARLAAAEQERDAAYALDLRDAPQAGNPTTCANVRRDLARLVEVGRIGEMESLRRRIAASGESIDSLAAEQQRFIRSLREAEAARAAASAASAGTGG